MVFFRRFPPGLNFNRECDGEDVIGGNTCQLEINSECEAKRSEPKGSTIDCRYSYVNDPTKYKEQPLPAYSDINIRPSRGKHVRNIRLRPRQTLCSKCRAAIHEANTNSKLSIFTSVGKPCDGQEQEVHPHNTRYKATLSGRSGGDNAEAPNGPILRSGCRSKRPDNSCIVMDSNRPKRDVRSLVKKRDSDATQRSKPTDGVKKAPTDDLSIDALSSCSTAKSKPIMSNNVDVCSDGAVCREDMMCLNNEADYGQCDEQSLVTSDQSTSGVPDNNEKISKGPPLIMNITRSTPKITISFGEAGDRDVLKIAPRLPRTDMKIPDSRSTADELPNTASQGCSQHSLSQKRFKKGSRRTRDKQRYRVVSTDNIYLTDEPVPVTIHNIGHHRRHKRKHKHRHASSEDENYIYDAEIGVGVKFPALVSKLSVLPLSSDLCGNEKRSDSEILKDSSNETPTLLDNTVDITHSQHHLTDTVSLKGKSVNSVDFHFSKDPLNLSISEDVELVCSKRSSEYVLNNNDLIFHTASANSGDILSHDVDNFYKILNSPVKISPVGFGCNVSPASIEADTFPSDISQDGLDVAPLKIGQSPLNEKCVISRDDCANVYHSQVEYSQLNHIMEDTDTDGETKSVPYGVGMFEDLTPDEDEGEPEHNVSEPLYQLPMIQKPHMIYGGWTGHIMPHTQDASDWSKKLVQSREGDPFLCHRTRVYHSTPTSYHSIGFASQSPYPRNLHSAFSHSTTPRIHNSPMPIIQSSPVPIFNYHPRYQSSPNRRFGNSPSRRCSSLSEVSTCRHHCPAEGRVGHSSALHPLPDGSTLRSLADGHYLTAHPVAATVSSKVCLVSRHVRKVDASNSVHTASASSRAGCRNVLHCQSERSRQPQSVGLVAAPVQEDSRQAIATNMGSTGSFQYIHPTEVFVSAPRLSQHATNPHCPIADRGSQCSSLQPEQCVQMSSIVERSIVDDTGGVLGTQLTDYSRSDVCQPAHVSCARPPPVSSAGRSITTPAAEYRAAGGDGEQCNSGVPSLPHHYETVDTSAILFSHSHGGKAVPESGHRSPLACNNLPVPSVSISPHKVISEGSGQPSHLPTVFHRSRPEDSTDCVGFSNANKNKCSFAGESAALHGRLQCMSHGGTRHERLQHQSSMTASAVDISDPEDDGDDAVPGILPTLATPMVKIQTQALISCRTKDGGEIRTGDVQWGKVQGFPWWPCQVCSIKLTHREHREQVVIVTQLCRVSWYGSSTVSDMFPSELRPFLKDFSKRYMKRKRGAYQTAVQQAMAVVGLSMSLGSGGGDVTRSHQPPYIATHHSPTVGLCLVQDLAS